jgi:hypothetical protein
MQNTNAAWPTIIKATGIALTCFLACSAGGGGGAQEVNPSSPNDAYLKESAAAMNKMMIDMDVKSTGDVDRDFVGMMIPHHQGAIDMAQALLKYGKNEQLRRLAQEIIITQQQEIAAMRLVVGQPLPPAAPAATTAPVTQPIPLRDHAHSKDES